MVPAGRDVVVAATRNASELIHRLACSLLAVCACSGTKEDSPVPHMAQIASTSVAPIPDKVYLAVNANWLIDARIYCLTVDALRVAGAPRLQWNANYSSWWNR